MLYKQRAHWENSDALRYILQACTALNGKNMQYKDFYYFKRIHKDDELAKIAYRIEQVGKTSNGYWSIRRDHIATKADRLVKQFRQREAELQQTLV